MKIKRFFAADIRQAMRMVKEELGADAVIMSNKSVDGGVEIIAARDFDERALETKVETPVKPEIKESKSAVKKLFEFPDYGAEKEQVHIVSSPRKRDTQMETTDRPMRREVDKYLGYAEKVPLTRMELNVSAVPKQNSAHKPAPKTEKYGALPIKEVINTLSSAPASTSNQIKVTPPEQLVTTKAKAPQAVEKKISESEFLMNQMRQEFRSLKMSMETRLAEVGFMQANRTQPVRMELLRRLADMGISKKLGIKIANRLGSHQESDFAFEKAQEMLAKILPVTNNKLLDIGGVVALVGPTGVGKTTTIAKLAAKFILKHGSRQVALITTDNYRIAAHEQLNTYGRILDVPVRAANSPDDLRNIINLFSDKKLILVDTAGMGPKDLRLMEQFKTLERADVNVSTHLVLSATTHYKAMQEILKTFQIVEPEACVLTKMDEAVNKGAAISALIENQLPLSFITDGQQVPEDIHSPDPHAIIQQCVAELDLENDYTDAVNYEEWVAQGYA